VERRKRTATQRRKKPAASAKGTELRIRSAKQLRALRTPLRQEIVQALTRLGACTVRELAGELGHEPAALYYHVHALEEAGIAVKTGSRTDGRRPENVYSLVAGRILIDRTENSRAFLSALVDLQRATLRTAERELEASVEARGRTGDDATALLRLTSRLRPGDAARAAKMLREVAEFLAGNDDPERGEACALTAVLTRLVG